MELIFFFFFLPPPGVPVAHRSVIGPLYAATAFPASEVDAVRLRKRH